MMQKMKRIECRMLGFRRNHSLEFYGNATRLVITPMTAKCQLALVSAMRYCVPTVCLGNSGWGKASLVQDMSVLLGNVYVSCTLSHATTVVELKSLLCGICSLGAWGVFEALCVASKGVLAIIAETIGTLQNAATAGLAAANVNGTLCALTYGWGIHFTASPMKMRNIGMSPSLRSLLRLVQFQVPDEQMILQALLISFGYMNPSRLSRLLAALLRKARLVFLKLDAIFSLRLLKKYCTIYSVIQGLRILRWTKKKF